MLLLNYKEFFLLIKFEKHGARNGIRTRDLNLGKVALYQLSYSRYCRSHIILFEGKLESQTNFTMY